MRLMLIGVLAVILLGNTHASAQELVVDFTADTVVYDPFSSSGLIVLPHPENLPVTLIMAPQNFFAFKKKNSNTYDIFSAAGKIGEFTYPVEIGEGTCIALTQTFIDTDDEWEALFNYPDGFKLVDNNGDVLLSVLDSNALITRPGFAFDGSNTYVCYRNPSVPLRFRAWRFRTNISSTSEPHPGLSKSTSAGPLPLMMLGASGNYTIFLKPAGGGKTSVQLLDILGRLIFEKTVNDLTKPVSITVPNNIVPRTPFIAKVQDSNGSKVKREIPVR